MAEPQITILQVELLNPQKIAISYSDRTTAVYNLDALLTLPADRVESDNEVIGG